MVEKNSTTCPKCLLPEHFTSVFMQKFDPACVYTMCAFAQSRRQLITNSETLDSDVLALSSLT